MITFVMALALSMSPVHHASVTTYLANQHVACTVTVSSGQEYANDCVRLTAAR